VVWFRQYGDHSRGYDGGKEEALIVHIGGGRGHDLKAFRNKFPKVEGKLVLPDF